MAGNHLKHALIKNSLGGRFPDTALVPSDFVGISSLIKLSEVPASLKNADIYENAYATIRRDGKIYGAPVLGGNHIMMYYNKKKVKKILSKSAGILKLKEYKEKLKKYEACRIDREDY